MFPIAYLGYGLWVGEALWEARVGVGAVWVGLWRVLESPTGCIGNVLLLQPRSWPGSLSDRWGRTGLSHIRALGSLVVVVPQATVAPLAVRVINLLAVKRGARWRPDRCVPVVLAGGASHWCAVVATGTHAAPHGGGHLVRWAPFALQVGVVVRRKLPIVWFLRHGVWVEVTSYGMRVAVMLGEPVMPPNGPVSIYGDAGLAGVQREVPAGGVQVARVAGVVVVEPVLLWSSEVPTTQGFGTGSSLLEARWALFAQRVGACNWNVVELLQQAVDGRIFGWSVSSNNSLKKIWKKFRLYI